MHKRNYTKLLVLILFSLGMGMNFTSLAQVKVGIFADCQYCSCDAKGVRYYKNSLQKLSDCLSEFNQQKTKFNIGLGDLIDKDFESFADVNTILKQSDAKVYQVTGNHDLSVAAEDLEKVPEALGMKNSYYTFQKKGWQFIFLDGNKLTVHSNNEKTVADAEALLKEMKASEQENANTWNGGLGNEQIEWLTAQLDKAERKNRKVALFCHYPILPFEKHVLWEGKSMLQLLDKYSCVKAWINGHNHAGNYAVHNGIHFVTFKGMVDTEAGNAFSVVEFGKENIKVEGFGREESRILEVR